jgi:protein subunit release factor B
MTLPVGFSGNWSGSIAPGATQNVTVTFSPTSVQSYGGNLTVASNATSGASVLACSGNGIIPIQIIGNSQDGSIDFGQVRCLEQGTISIKIINTSGQKLFVEQPFSAVFNLSGSFGSVEVEAGQEIFVPLVLSASGGGPISGLLDFNYGFSPYSLNSSVSVPAHAEIISPSIQITGDLSFGNVEVIDTTPSDMGGYKDMSIGIKSKGTPKPGQTPYAKLKFEGGVHRVQRVPETESQGRIHTSAAGVLILPEAEEIDVDINMNDLRIDVYRSSGPGGQSVNTTDSAVRITHVPTGIVVSCQNEKSQLQNKESALRILRARMLAAAQEEADRIASVERKSQVRTVDRSERIRTYNFPENRLSDHRVNYKANNLDSVMNGDLEAVIQSLIEADRTAKLAAGNS